ncbi:MAG: exodeoxyribonuclease VII small subunit [bacterium]
MATRKKSPDIEQSIQKLEAIVERMESNSLSLDESLKAYEEGIKITRECQQALADAEQKVEILSKTAGGGDT